MRHSAKLQQLVVTLFIMLMVFCVAPSANADTVYTYTGNAYTSCGGAYCVGGPYALSVTLDTTLSGNALDNLPDAELDKPGPKHFEKICPTVGAVFTLIGSHVMMHVGQFAAARRLLGKPVLI